MGALVVLIAVNDGISPLPLAAKPMEVLLLVQIKLVAATAPVKFIALVGAVLHIAWLAGWATLGVGFTVIVKNLALPGQPFAIGVTVMKPVAGKTPVLTPVKDGIFPEPLAAKPIEVLSLVQLKPVPLTVPEKFITPTVPLLQTVWFDGCTTFGVGFTVIVNVRAVPGQIPSAGVTVIVAIALTLPLLTAVKAGISPLPLAARPIEGLLFVQLKVVPLTVPVNAIAFVVAPLHNSWFAGWVTLGIGFTVIENVSGVPVQVKCVGVTVIIAVTGVLPVLIAVNAPMFPVPLAAKPIEGLSLVQLKTVPGGVPVKVIALVLIPLHKAWFAGFTIVGMGYIVINLMAFPKHPPGIVTLNVTL